MRSIESSLRRARRAPSAPALALLAFLTSFGAAQEANAAAWYLGEISPRALGRGGANIVNPKDPTAMWLNPAAITNSTGLQLQVDGTLVFMNSSFIRDCGPNNDCGPIDVERDYGDGRTYSVNGKGRSPPNDDEDLELYAPTRENLGIFAPAIPDGHAVTNQAPFQGIPGMWATLNLDSFGLDGIAVGAALYAPRAGDYSFGEDEYTRFTLIDRNLLEVYYGLTAAYRFRNWIAVGASVQGVSAGVDQHIKLSGDFKGNENPDADIGVHINTLTHFIPSANFGVWSNPLPGFELGASVQLGRSVQASGPVTLESFGPRIQELIDSETVVINQDNPTALSAFELPPFYRVGAKYGMQGLFDGLFGFEIETDFVYEQWSTYDHVYLRTDGITMQVAGGEPTPLEPIVQPKDWMDAWSVRVGGEVNFFEEMLALRSGVYYETDAIPTTTYAVDLMNGQQIGLGLGGSVKLWGARLDVGYGHVFMFDRTVGNESIVHAETIRQPALGHDEPRTRIAMGQYTTSYDVVSVGLNIAFDEMLGFGVYADRPAKSDDAPPIAPAPAEPAPLEPETPSEGAPSPPEGAPTSDEEPGAAEPAGTDEGDIDDAGDEEPETTPVSA